MVRILHASQKMNNKAIFKVDRRVKEHLSNLTQIALYITDNCNLRCEHCFYKPDIIFRHPNRELPLKTAISLISTFKKLGASKLTIIGGEPTLYGISKDWKPLLLLIEKAKDIGYEYVRIDTNGQFNPSLLKKEKFKLLNELSFSLDGPTLEINDLIRGENSFLKCISNIRRAIKLGYRVDITCCVHKELLKRDKNKMLYLESMIFLAQNLGVKRINFHGLFKMGVPRDTWTNSLNLLVDSVDEWINVYKEIQDNIIKRKYTISIRLPLGFTTKEEFKKNLKYYAFCPAKIGERVIIHPNGIIRICSLMIGTPYGIARFYDNKIVWDESPTNELNVFKKDRYGYCPYQNQGKSKIYGHLIPLCISFKPGQEEYAWSNRLNWEKKKNN